MGLRLKSIRQRILLLVLVPVLSMIGLYAFATSLTARAALDLDRSSTLYTATAQPILAFVSQLDAERPLAMVYLSSPPRVSTAKLDAQESKTNASSAALRAALNSSATQNNASAVEKQAITTLLKSVAALPSLRSQIADRIITRQRAFSTYSSVVEEASRVLTDTATQQPDVPWVTQALAVLRIFQSQEMLLREDALVVGDLAARTFPAADRQQFTELVGARRTLFSETLPDFDPSIRAYYVHDVSPQAANALASIENRLSNDNRPGSPLPVQPGTWEKAVGGVTAGLSQAFSQAASAVVLDGQAKGHASLQRLILAGGLGMLAVILSIVVSILVGRGLVRELAVLRESALDLANRRLPAVMARLREGEDVDVSADAPAVPAKSNEIGQVGQAFATVQKTAVEAAAGEARLRRGINDIFRNLARRSQSLLHRQLSLLDAMERKAAEPEELEDLFRIDHLTTRMRRHAESLIILSGDAPARGWRSPVPLVDVLRAAVAEVEDYTRIKVTSTTRAALAGPAVGDIIHMIAELVENAAIFSPPNTPVLISGDIVGRGFAVEIEDRGLGLSEEKRAEINARLADPPQFDLFGSDQLGLFVAGQLAKRHNVRISLRSSPYGGTTAIVLIPTSLVVPEGAYDRDSAAASPDDHGFRLTGRHSARAADLAEAATAAAAAPPEPAAAVSDSLPHPGDAIWPEPPGPMAEDPANTADLSELDLPRRVRQASLAPQLRDSGNAGLAADEPPGDAGLPADDRSPEDARATIAALQQGWQRGRSVFDPPDRKATAAADAEPPAAEPPAEVGAAGDNGSSGSHQSDE